MRAGPRITMSRGRLRTGVLEGLGTRAEWQATEGEKCGERKEAHGESESIEMEMEMEMAREKKK